MKKGTKSTSRGASPARKKGAGATPASSTKKPPATRAKAPKIRRHKALVERSPSLPPSPWSEVEDYYLQGHRTSLTTEELAEKLNRTPAEVEARMKELPSQTIEETLKGFQVHPNGVVAMTASRSHQDDKRMQRGRPGGKPQAGERYQHCSSPIWKK